MLTITRLFGSAAPATATVVVVAASAFVSAAVANSSDVWGAARATMALGFLGPPWACLGSLGLSWASCALSSALGSLV